ncbi:NUDIX domain-containing protein [Gordonia sp. ABSL1-1]|uniref:NUDIX hydrolase n=1 Tax=Gordonia sp. ABSL1-1 TaxID=3053923 RepID=UPI002573488A|nr:NUDIX domain-containing protein [Gordonia sp. ABSL1-1]MDL9937968.1 NUDIX domain-containing protein [Gordonia sp. ABSL1-1]
MTTRIVAVGSVITDDAGRILLVLRRNPPQAGHWSLPGGKVQPGEELVAAAAREVAEETGLVVDVGAEISAFEISAADGRVFVVHDFRASVRSGELRAGDDAVRARWFSPNDLPAMRLTSGLLDFLAEVGVVDDDPHLSES